MNKKIYNTLLQILWAHPKIISIDLLRHLYLFTINSVPLDQMSDTTCYQEFTRHLNLAKNLVLFEDEVLISWKEKFPESLSSRALDAFSMWFEYRTILLYKRRIKFLNQI